MILQWEMIHNDPWVYYLMHSLCVYCFHYGLYVFPIMSFTLTMWLCEWK